jgi:endonuclease III
MTDTTRTERRVATLLERHGRTFADELDIALARDTPEALFCWLVTCILYSARIDARIATKAARAVDEAGWTTADALAASAVDDRIAVLDRAHYTRYDERTARRLGEAAAHVRDRYDGDLRRLRVAVGGDAKATQRLLQEIPGLGPTGAKIFCREAQAAWDELYPFCDEKAWSAAKDLGLARSVKELAGLVPPPEFPRLVAALARCALAHDEAGVRAAARTRAAADEGAQARRHRAECGAGAVGWAAGRVPRRPAAASNAPPSPRHGASVRSFVEQADGGTDRKPL